MRCINCNSELEGSFKYCPNCGNNLTEDSIDGGSLSVENSLLIVCEVCGEENDGLHKFCKGCGSVINNSGRIIEVSNVAGEKKKVQQKKNSSVKKPSKQKREVKSSKSSLSTSQIYLIFAGILFVGFLLMYVSGVIDTPKVNHDHSNQTDLQGLNEPNYQAINDLRNRMLANPNDINLMLQLAHTLHDNGMYEEAITNYKKYIEVDSSKPEIFIDAGVCYFNLKKYDEAISMIKKGLELNPDHLIGNYNMGIVYLSKGEREEAVKWFNKVIALEPNSKEAKQAKELISSHL